GGSMTVSNGATLTVNGGQIGNGYLGGAGTIATSSANGARFAGLRVVPSITIASNSGTDRYTNVQNGGALVVAAALSSAVGLNGNNGAVFDGTGGSATVVADYGALVKGAGFFANPVITQNGGRVQAGNSPGSLSFGSLTLGPGVTTSIGFQINNATGVAGPA